jgi:glutathione S-transferase
MIRLYGFGPTYGLPDPSPFVIKAEVLLKMSGLLFEKSRGDMRKNPKGKIPYIVDEGQLLGDSTLIRFHLEDRHNVQFDDGVSAPDLAVAWAFEKLCEDHLYWAVVRQRWMDDGNFERGPSLFFKSVPGLIRPFITRMVRRKIARNLFCHGFGRYSEAEGRAIVMRGFQAVADCLATRDFLGGAKPCGSDATLFAFMASALVPTIFTGYPTEEIRKHPAIVAYVERMKALYYPAGFSA